MREITHYLRDGVEDWAQKLVIFHGTHLRVQGGLPEWPKGADCKSAAECFGGSNPSSATVGKPGTQRNRAFPLPGPRLWLRDTGQNVVMWPLLVSKLWGLVLSLGLPLACRSFSGPESFFGCEGGVVLFEVAPERNGARLAQRCAFGLNNGVMMCEIALNAHRYPRLRQTRTIIPEMLARSGDRTWCFRRRGRGH